MSVMQNNKYYICYAKVDKPYATALAFRMRSEGFTIFFDVFDILPGQDFNEIQLAATDTLIVLLSTASIIDESVLNTIDYALAHKNKIVPVLVEDCEIPAPIKRFQSINLKHYSDGLNQMMETFRWLHGSNPKSYSEPMAPQSFPRIAPSPRVKTSLIKTVFDKINPFKNLFKDKSVPYLQTEAYSDPAFYSQSAGEGSEPAEPLSMPNPFVPEAPPAVMPAGVPGGVTPPFAKSPKGMVLYDIPDSMMVNRQHKCIVRIGENEAVVKDNDSFSPAMQIESITISGVMKVDLIDVSDPPRFIIKTINSAEQEVEAGSYTEWLFWVTPVGTGNFSLILKISILKMVDGKEVRKELVFEKAVEISAEPQQQLTPAMQSFVAAKPVQPALKELLNEKNIKELNPPVAFISYAHKDKVYFDIFTEYLKSQSGWSIWTDRNIEVGSDWYQRIQQSISNADMALLLVSADFISSAFIKEHEFKPFGSLQAEKPGFIFLPILLRDVDFTRWKELAAMQLFTAYGDEYGVPDKKGQLIPFAKLCRFSNEGQLIPNDNIDTYFKNLVKTAEKDWLKTKVV